MCPVCIATAALIAGKVTSASGAAVVAVRKLGGKKVTDNKSASENAAAGNGQTQNPKER